MGCHDFRVRVDQLLDRHCHLTEDAALAEHAAQCPGCRRLLAGYESLLETVALLDEPPLADDMAVAVVRRFHAQPRSKRRQAWQTGLAWVAAALVIAAALPPGWRIFAPAPPSADRAADLAADLAVAPRNEAVAPVSAATAFAGERDLPPPQHPSGNPSLAENSGLESDFVAAAAVEAPLAADIEPSRLSNEELRWLALASPWEGVPLPWPARTATGSEAEDSTPAASPPPWVHQMASPFRPVASSVSTAILILRQALPGAKDASSGNPPQALLPEGWGRHIV